MWLRCLCQNAEARLLHQRPQLARLQHILRCGCQNNALVATIRG